MDNNCDALETKTINPLTSQDQMDSISRLEYLFGGSVGQFEILLEELNRFQRLDTIREIGKEVFGQVCKWNIELVKPDNTGLGWSIPKFTRLVYASTCEPCPICRDPWCALHELHCAECECECVGQDNKFEKVSGEISGRRS